MNAATTRTTKSAESARQSADAAQTDMEVQIETLKQEIEKLKAQLQSSGERSFTALKNIAKDGVSEARTRGEATVADLKDRAGDVEAELVARVREKPVTSLAIAAGVGFLFALLSRR